MKYFPDHFTQVSKLDKENAERELERENYDQDFC
jgi:hypothetical protein